MSEVEQHPRSAEIETEASSKQSQAHVPFPTYFAVACGLIAIAFYQQLSVLWTLSRSSELYSHTILIPIVSIYLAWENRSTLKPSKPLYALALLPLAIAVSLLWIHLKGTASPSNADQVENYLAYSILSLVAFVWTAACLTLGRETIRANIFPLLFLLFLATFPVPVREAIETFFQHSSADAAYWLINLSGIPIFRDGLVFQMPTIVMEVAPQCSGIRSSLVLFIVSLVASYLFLKSPWKRTILVLLVIPLGIIRNGIRILILAQLCYRIGPEMIDSWFHRSGGPPLFALTLIPLFLLLYLFRRSEQKKDAPLPVGG